MMRRLALDFAPPSCAATLERTRLASWLLVALGLALIAGAVQRARETGAARDAREAEHQGLETRLAARERRAPAPRPAPIRPEQARAVNAIVDRLNLPWSAVFESIESATPPQIALLALEPDPGRHAMKGLAEARDSGDMLAYIERLGREPLFDTVTLAKHEINDQDPNRPLRFEFLATWSGKTP